ncbi:MAG: hypothetical protein HRT99_04205 [Mycoplasmatales bacterium]|nr:hypothetical protein [Mycoplasmatales bacterium]
MGRMDSFKFSALKPLIVNTLSKLENVELHVVGDGIKIPEVLVPYTGFDIIS